MKRKTESGRRGLGWSPLPAIAVCLLLLYYPDAGLLRETTFWPMLLSLALITVGLLSARPAVEQTVVDELSTDAKWILVIVGAILTAAFWWRAWIALPSVWLAHQQLLLVQVAAFWWPAVFFAALCRQQGQGLRPPSHRAFLRQLGWGMVGACLGVMVQLVVPGLMF